jgi:hypothetical protein
MRHAWPAPLALSLALAASGCATSLSGFQPAHVAPKGHATAEMGMDLSIPTGTISRAIKAGQTLAAAARTRSLTTEERRQLIEAGANATLAPLWVVMHVGGTFVPVSRLELGVRWASGAFRGGARYQLLDHARDGLDLSAGVGVSRFAYDVPSIDAIEQVLKVDDFVRWSVDFPILVGKHSEWYRLWGGPRIMLSRFSSAMRLELPANPVSPAETVLASVDGNAAFVGAQGGVAIGYRYLFLAFELNVVRLFSDARLQAATLDQDVDLSGWVIYPGVALMGEF